MTLAQIQKMTDDEISNHVLIELMVDSGASPVKHYAAAGLNAAMKLVPQFVGTRESAKQLEAFYEAFLCVTGIGGGDNLYDMFRDFGGYRATKLPRALCEAFLLWKTGAK